MAFLLHFKDDLKIKNKKFISLYYLLPDLMCYILLHSFHISTTSKCFLSNGIKNMDILASGAELQAVRFGYVLLGEHLKKGPDP